jgi:hypothetical protein
MRCSLYRLFQQLLRVGRMLRLLLIGAPLRHLEFVEYV